MRQDGHKPVAERRTYMYKLTNWYLDKHYDAESGEKSGNTVLLQICMRYQCMCWWWKWHKEQPKAHGLAETLYWMAYVAIHKATF